MPSSHGVREGDREQRWKLWVCPACHVPQEVEPLSLCESCEEATVVEIWVVEASRLVSAETLLHQAGEDRTRIVRDLDAALDKLVRAEAERDRLRGVLERIRDWDGDEEYLADVEVELKALARSALESGSEGSRG